MRAAKALASVVVLLTALAAVRPDAVASERSRLGAVASGLVPIPQRVHPGGQQIKQARTALVAMQTAPFPYHGVHPATGRPFLDHEENGERGRRGPHGRVLWERDTYNDPRALLHIPAGFDTRRASLMVLFFHGHGATLEADVIARQQVPEQISLSRANAVLVAPQLASNAADSSPGRLWEHGACARLTGEAGRQLALLHGDPRSELTFREMPVVIVAYSGGYLAAASCIARGGLERRLRGLVLLDALYGEVETFAEWRVANPAAILISAHTVSTRARNERLRAALDEQGIASVDALADRLAPGTVAFLATGPGITHRDYVTSAWTAAPVADVLSRITGPGRR